MNAKHWYDYLWVYAIIYFALGFFNILFACLGMIDFHVHQIFLDCGFIIQQDKVFFCDEVTLIKKSGAF